MDRSIFDGSNINIKYGKKFQYLEKFVQSKMYKRRCNEKSEKKEREKENISFPGIVSGIIL